MSESKHTPGPWMVGGPHPSVSVIVCVDGGSGYPDPHPPTYEPVCIVDQRTEGEPSELALADAHLIAAAPEMLAALRACLAYIPGSEVRSWPPGFRLRDEALKLTRAAIAKAEKTPDLRAGCQLCYAGACPDKTHAGYRT